MTFHCGQSVHKYTESCTFVSH